MHKSLSIEALEEKDSAYNIQFQYEDANIGSNEIQSLIENAHGSYKAMMAEKKEKMKKEGKVFEESLNQQLLQDNYIAYTFSALSALQKLHLDSDTPYKETIKGKGIKLEDVYSLLSKKYGDVIEAFFSRSLNNIPEDIECRFVDNSIIIHLNENNSVFLNLHDNLISISYIN